MFYVMNLCCWSRTSIKLLYKYLVAFLQRYDRWRSSEIHDEVIAFASFFVLLVSICLHSVGFLITVRTFNGCSLLQPIAAALTLLLIKR